MAQEIALVSAARSCTRSVRMRRFVRL